MATNIIKTVMAIGGDYTSLAAWEAGEQRDLVTLNQIASAECYGMIDSTSVTINGWTTGTANYVNIYAATGARMGAVWDETGSSYLLDTNIDSIVVGSNHDVRIDGIGIRCRGGGFEARYGIIRLSGTSKFELSNCFLRAGTIGYVLSMIYLSGDNSKIWNNIIVDVGTGLAKGAIRPVGSGTHTIYNNTFYNNIRGIYGPAGMGALRGKNNIAQYGSAGTAVAEPYGTFTFTSDSGWNLSPSGTAPGSNNILNATVAFIDEANLNLSLMKGASAQNVGTDLSSDSYIAFSTDIFGGTRPIFGTWDVGAHEATIGVINKDSQLVWNVGTFVGRSSQLVWDVGTLAGRSSQFLWSVRPPLPIVEDYFLEIDVGYQLRRWVASGTTNVWKHDFIEDDPNALSVDGTSYTEMRTLADCVGTANTFWIDRGTAIYINTAGIDPNTRIVELISTWHFSRKNNIVAKKLGLYRTITPIFWDGRLVAVPTMRQEAAPDALGGGNQLSFGNVILRNNDNRFQRYVDALLYGRSVRAYIGRGEVIPTDFMLIGKMQIERASKDRDVLVLNLSQDIAALNMPINGGSVFVVGTDGNQNIRGQPVPFIIGSLAGIPAYMVQMDTATTGIFRLCVHDYDSILAVRNKDGTALSAWAKLGTEGYFVAQYGSGEGTRFQNEAVFVDCTGYGGSTLIGESMKAILTDRAGIAGSDILTNDFDSIDVLRPVTISGWFGRGETIRDVLDDLSRSGFISWGVTREGKYTAWIRRQDFDTSNELIDPSFESDGTAWLDANGGTHTGTTLPWLKTEYPEGTRVCQLSKPAGTAGMRAHIYQGGITAVVGTTYAMSCLAALQSGTLNALRMEYIDAGGSSHLSGSVALMNGSFQRVYGLFSVGTTGKGTLSIYPDYDGTVEGTAWIDDVKFHPIKVIHKYQVAAITTEIIPPRNDRVSVRYMNTQNKIDRIPPLRFQTDEDFLSSFALATSDISTLLYDLETMTHEGILWDTADAQTVAEAILRYRNKPRFRLSLDFLDTSAMTISRGDIIYIANDIDDIWLPDGHRTFLVTEVSDSFEGGSPRTTSVVAERSFFAIYDYMNA